MKDPKEKSKEKKIKGGEIYKNDNPNNPQKITLRKAAKLGSLWGEERKLLSFSDMLIEHCDDLLFKKMAPEGTDYKQFKMGMKVEMEHKDVSQGNRKITAKIVLAHLKEKPDYYTRLKKVEGR